MAEEGWQDERAVVRVQWMDATECGPFATVSMDRRWEGAVSGTDVAGRGVVREGVGVYSVVRVDCGEGRDWPVGGETELARELQSIAIVYVGRMRLLIT